MAMFIWKIWEHVGFTTQKQSTEQHSCSSCSSAKIRNQIVNIRLQLHIFKWSPWWMAPTITRTIWAPSTTFQVLAIEQVGSQKTKWENRAKTVGKTMGKTMGHGQPPYFLHFPSLPKSWKTVRCPVLFPETQCYSNQGKDRQEMTLESFQDGNKDEKCVPFDSSGLQVFRTVLFGDGERMMALFPLIPSHHLPAAVHHPKTQRPWISPGVWVGDRAISVSTRRQSFLSTGSCIPASSFHKKI